MNEKKDLSQTEPGVKKASPSLALGLLLAAMGWGLDGMAGFAPNLPVHTISAALLVLGLGLVLFAALQMRLGRAKAAAGASLWILLLGTAGLLWSPPVRLDVTMAPQPFPSAGRQHLAYEIRLRHYGWRPMQIRQVRVMDGQRKERGRFESDFLGRGPWGETSPQALQLPAGGELILYLWLSLDKDEELPSQLTHEVSWSPVGEVAAGGLLQGALTEVEGQDPPAIGPPLRSGPWMAQAGPSNWSRHRRARALEYLAQRFATDWVRVDEQGRSWAGPQEDNRSYFAYGAEVLAVAAGTVVEVRDKIPENRPPEQTIPVSFTTFAGNSVVLRLEKGLCALYAHLQPGSLRVSEGQAVKRGEVLGLVGNSGYSSEPHLHLQLTYGCSPIRSEGVPYVYEGYQSHGYFPYGQSFQLPPPQLRRLQLPLQSEIVTFVEPRPTE